MVHKDFDVGELVWAQMKTFPPWPAKIAEPPGKPKKDQHYVYFLASNNYGWIPDERIFPHTEEMIKEGRKRKFNQLQDAIDIIEKEEKSAPKRIRVHDSPRASGKPDAFDKLMNSKTLNLKTPPKRKMPKVFPEREIPDMNGSGISFVEDDSVLTPSKCFSLTDKTLGTTETEEESRLPCAILKKRGYIDRPSTPPLDLEEKGDSAEKVYEVAPTSKKIGFIGLSGIGRGIVKNLLHSGHDVTVWHVNPEVCTPFIAAGAKTATTILDVVESCDIIFSYVSGAEEAKQNVFQSYGVLKGLDKNAARTKGYVELTTVDASSVKEMAQEILNKDAKYLEAPVSGSRSLAEDGRLLVIAGGDQELFQECKSCFHAFSKTSCYIGSTHGNASNMNIILSMFEGTVIAALAEALTLARSCKLSCEDVQDIMKTKSLISRFIEEKGTSMVKTDYTCQTLLSNQKRDLELALSLADEFAQPLNLAATANEMFKSAIQKCYQEHDVSAVIEAVRLDDGKS